MNNLIFKNENTIFHAILAEICSLIFFIILSCYFLIMQLHWQKNLHKAGQLRYDSYLLADQLRQSSDDLTRMVRTYAATGNSMFEDYFWEILAIREGKRPRPIHYDRIFWDFMTVKAPVPPFPRGEKIPLEQLMQEAGFTKKELQLLDEAKQKSDKLVSLENIAMHAMKGQFQDKQAAFSIIGEPDPALARQILFGEEYHDAKKRIMEPINAFFRLIDQRTSKNFEQANLQAIFYQRALFVTFIALIMNGVLLFVTTKRHQGLMLDKLETDVKERTKELSVKNQEVKDSEERFRSLSDAAFEGIIISDKGKIIEANHQMVTIFGYSLTELADMHSPDLVSPESRDKVRKNILSGYEKQYEANGLKKDGTLIPLIMHGKMFSYKGQRVRVTAVRDVTEQKKAQEEIKKLQGILPICMHCKEIRDDKGYWNRLEEYISKHSDAQFSHSICDKCLKKYYPEFAEPGNSVDSENATASDTTRGDQRYSR